MGRGWRPILAGAVVVVAVFALAKAQIFAPSAPASTTLTGDATRGASVFAENCSGCHGDAGQGGGVGPTLAASGLDAATVASVVQQGRGVMPPGIVAGQQQADVVAYVVSIANQAK